MKNKINEASIKLDVNGLESDDFDTLSRMLALAGQAESQQGSNPGMSSLPKMQPLDFDAFGDDHEEAPMAEPMGEPELGGEEELSLDLDGAPSLESGDEFEEEEDDFDFGRMSELAGLGESVSLATAEDEAGQGEVEAADELEQDEEDAAAEELSEKLLPDLSLDEDAEARSDDGDRHHVVDSKEHGPFRTEREAVHDAMKVTNGTEFEHFAIIPGRDGYYWRRNLQEGFDNEPDPCEVDMDGIENNRHEFKRVPGTALGDNPLAEAEECKCGEDPCKCGDKLDEAEKCKCGEDPCKCGDKLDEGKVCPKCHEDPCVCGKKHLDEGEVCPKCHEDPCVCGKKHVDEGKVCPKCHEDPCVCGKKDHLEEDVEDILESIQARYNAYIKGL